MKKIKDYGRENEYEENKQLTKENKNKNKSSEKMYLTLDTSKQKPKLEKSIKKR